MPKKETTDNDPLSGGAEVRQEKFAFGKPGDFIKGTYVGKKEVKTPNGPANIYEIKALIGSYHPITKDENDNEVPAEEAVSVTPGNFYAVWGDKGKTVDSGFQKAALGQIVAIRFEERVKMEGKKSWKKKKFLVYEMDSTYMGEDSNEIQISKDDAPF